MKNLTLILLLAFIVLSFHSSRGSKNFATPKSLIETFIHASTTMKKKVLSQCFSEQSPKEWDKIRNKTISESELEELKGFVTGAEITDVLMQGENDAIVMVKFTSRNEKIHTLKENGRWYILDF